MSVCSEGSLKKTSTVSPHSFNRMLFNISLEDSNFESSKTNDFHSLYSSMMGDRLHLLITKVHSKKQFQRFFDPIQDNEFMVFLSNFLKTNVNVITLCNENIT